MTLSDCLVACVVVGRRRGCTGALQISTGLSIALDEIDDYLPACYFVRSLIYSETLLLGAKQKAPRHRRKLVDKFNLESRNSVMAELTT